MLTKYRKESALAQKKKKKKDNNPSHCQLLQTKSVLKHQPQCELIIFLFLPGVPQYKKCTLSLYHFKMGSDYI